MDDDKQANEGEGSRSADRRYRKGVERTVERGHVGEQAEQAARDVDADPAAFREAEEQGKARSAGELPSDLEGGAAAPSDPQDPSDPERP